MAHMEAKLGKKNIFKELRCKVVAESKKSDGSGLSAIVEIKLIVDLHLPPMRASKGERKKPSTQEAYTKNFGLPMKGWGGLVGTQLDLCNSIKIFLAEDDAQLIRESTHQALIDDSVELHNYTIIYGC
ncbi:hypothetical protein DEO72_LG6g1114 [Vigna unguiculata]|uniref:Uncharacterized protein n=1 Tax=Vigna unguiculata TaxID=3917 RepID=A0A4D6M548_VIGUN|nr:hypothetical protein DEO72_LG6g1114 [Vigna unguiculata]